MFFEFLSSFLPSLEEFWVVFPQDFHIQYGFNHFEVLCLISVSFPRFLYDIDQLGGDLAVLAFFSTVFAVFGQLWGVLGGFQRLSLSILTVFCPILGEVWVAFRRDFHIFIQF